MILWQELLDWNGLPVDKPLMLNIKAIRTKPDYFVQVFNARGVEITVSELLTLDAEVRSLKTEVQNHQSALNTLSKEYGIAIRNGRDVSDLSNKIAETKDELQRLSARAAIEDAHFEQIMMRIPNDLLLVVPTGADETSNRIISQWGERDNDLALPHYNIELGLDAETAAKISGSRFTFLRGEAARLHRALGQFMLDHATAEGFLEVVPPLIVNSEAMEGTGQLPKFGDDAYHLPMDDRQQWLIPTSEVSLTNSVAHSIMAERELPLRFTALTPCFRKEAGSAGRDTRGLLRQHQFDKVELVTICTPDNSIEEHERITRCAEMVLEKLDLRYRRVLLCSGDTGFSSAMTYDLEVWMPGMKEWREISSCSNCLDFQARRMQARYRPEGTKGTEYVHTLNGSALAVGRTLAAVMEQYWDGQRVVWPAILTTK